MAKSKFPSYPWQLPMAYLQNLANYKCSLPVEIFSKKPLKQHFLTRLKSNALGIILPQIILNYME